MSDCFNHYADAIDEWCFGDTSFEGYGRGCWEKPAQYKTCRNCGATRLRWGIADGKWKLFEKGQVHQCVSPASLDDFDDLA